MIFCDEADYLVKLNEESHEKKLLFCVWGIFYSSVISAGGWSGSTKVLEIYPSPGHNGILIKHSSMPNPDSCSSPTLYILDKDNVFFDQIFALMISAQARQSNINLYVNDCKGLNDVFPSIYQVVAK